jgi:hypothetical protein
MGQQKRRNTNARRVPKLARQLVANHNVARWLGSVLRGALSLHRLHLDSIRLVRVVAAGSEGCGDRHNEHAGIIVNDSLDHAAHLHEIKPHDVAARDGCDDVAFLQPSRVRGTSRINKRHSGAAEVVTHANVEAKVEGNVAKNNFFCRSSDEKLGRQLVHSFNQVRFLQQSEGLIAPRGSE